MLRAKKMDSVWKDWDEAILARDTSVFAAD
jgi:hypothetical protein